MTTPRRLPLTYRPRKGRIVPYALAGLTVLVCTALAAALPGGTGQFGLADRLGIVGIGVAVAAFLCVLARPRATVDEGGLRVVNIFRARTLEWAEVVDVSLNRGDPWVMLDLSDGETIAVMAIQASDGDYARRSAQELLELVTAHNVTERDD